MTTITHGIQNTSRSRPQTSSPQEALSTPLLEGTVPKADCRSLQRLISQLVSTALAPFSTPLPTLPEKAPTPQNQTPVTPQTEQCGLLNRFLARLRSGLISTVALTADFVRNLTAAALRAVRKESINATSPLIAEPTTTNVHSTNPANTHATGDVRKIISSDTPRARPDEACSSVAEACQKSARKKKVQDDRNKTERTRQYKDETAQRIKGIDQENGITNPDLPIIIANMMSSFGEESTAIRAVIEAQDREVVPHKKKT